jgi:hypothetical protein
MTEGVETINLTWYLIILSCIHTFLDMRGDYYYLDSG